MLTVIRRGMMMGLMGYAGYGFAFAPVAVSQKSLLAVPSERVIRPETVAEAAPRSFITGESARMEVDSKSGSARVVEGRLMAGQKALRGSDVNTYATSCRDYILNHDDVFGVAAEDLTFEEQSALIDSDVQFIRYLVSRDGLLIEDASINCRFKRGELVQVANQSFSEAVVTSSKNSPESAAATDALLTSWVKSAADTYRVQEEAHGYSLVRVANHEIMHQGVPHRLQVERSSHASFELKPLHYFEKVEGVAEAEAYARFYKQPLITMPLSNVKLSDNSVTDVKGGFSAAEALSMTGFSGTRQKMALKSGTAPKVTAQMKDNKWLLHFKSASTEEKYADKDMAQAMVYIHLNKISNHALAYIHPKWLDSALPVNVNLTQTCNAYWDGSSVNFFSSGGGCANTGLISDVMYHEWGHGLHANTGGIKDGAFSEGFGDINAFVITRDPVLGRGFKINSDDGIRDMSEPKVYPGDVGDGEVHRVGKIIASTLFDTYKGLETVYGADKSIDLLSKYIYKGIYTAVKYTDMYKAMLVIDDNDTNPENGTPNLCLINKAFTAHGLATKDSRCLLPSSI